MLMCSEAVVASLKEGRHNLDEETLGRIMEVMLAPHKHKHRKLRKSQSGLPQGMSN